MMCCSRIRMIFLKNRHISTSYTNHDIIVQGIQEYGFVILMHWRVAPEAGISLHLFSPWERIMFFPLLQKVWRQSIKGKAFEI